MAITNDKDKKKKKDPFDSKQFKKGVFFVETNNGKHLWNKKSSATGKYQFLYNGLKHLPFMKNITREQFLKNEVLQEKVMDMAINGKLQDRPGYIRNAKDLSNEFKDKLGDKWNYRPDEVALLSHYLGRQGARNYFNSIADGKEYKVNGKSNLKVQDYLERYNKGAGSKRGLSVETIKNRFSNVGMNQGNPKATMESLQRLDNINPQQRELPNFQPQQAQQQVQQQAQVQQPQAQQPQMQTQAQWLDGYLGENKFAVGGDLKNKNMNNLFDEGGNMLTEFNSGGTHEQNPMGGIPQGMGANGKPNLVEEGETRMGDFIFSDRLELTKDLVDVFKLPKAVSKMTIADASKYINSFSEESNKSIDKETTKELLERLQNANNFLKEMNEAPQEQQQGENQFADGTEMDVAKSGPGIGSYMGAASGAVDIFNSFSGKDGNTNMAAGIGGGALKGAAAGASFGPWGAAVGGVLGAVGGGFGAGAAKKRELRQDNTDASANFNEVYNTHAFGGDVNGEPKPGYPENPDDLINQFKSNKEGLEYQNPYPNRSNRWEKFNQYQTTLGRTQGPTSLGTPNYGTKNPFTGNSAMSNGITGKKVLEQPQQKMMGQEDINTIASNNFKFGTKLTNQFELNSPQKPFEFNLDPLLGGKKTDTMQDRIFNNVPNNEARTTATNNRIMDQTKSPTFGDKLGDFGKKAGNFLDKNSEKLRFAPAAMNAYQLANLEKPDQESLSKLDKRFKHDYVDEAALTNQAREQYAGTAGRIANASNGSLGSLRSNLLGAQANQTKGLSNSFLQADNINRQQNMTGQQFDLGVDQFNIGQNNREQDINAKNKGAYDTNKSKLLAELGNNLGGVGLEQLRKKYPELMGMDYNTLGKFLKNTKTA